MRMCLILAALSLGLMPAAGQAQTAPAVPVITPEAVKAHVDFLADDLLEGRGAGTRGHEVAARYVATRFEALGLEPGGPGGSWYQRFPLVTWSLDSAEVTITRTSNVKIVQTPNVIGVLPGSDPALANEYVVLSAHLDHLGIDENAPGDDKIFNGAMDNAAGVATMLEAARAFVESGKRPKRSVLFVAHRFKPVWFDPRELRGHVERSYKP